MKQKKVSSGLIKRMKAFRKEKGWTQKQLASHDRQNQGVGRGHEGVVTCDENSVLHSAWINL